MAIHELTTSFNAGELSPQMDARVAVEKYAAGCRVLRNFINRVHGPVERRPGLEFLGRSLGATAPRLQGLEFARSRVMMEIALGGFRFWRDGVLLNVPVIEHPYDLDELQEVQVIQVNDVIYLVHANHEPLILQHYGDEDWRLRDVHEPLAGWSASPPADPTPSTGNAVLKRWVTTALQLNSLASSVAWANAKSPTQTVAAAGAPQGTGTSWAASIQRVQAYFVPKTTGAHKFKAYYIDDHSRIMLETAANGTGTGAVPILIVGDGVHVPATGESATYALEAGKGYWMEFLLNDRNRPSFGQFQVSVDAGAWNVITADYLAANLKNSSVGSNGSLIGWPAMLDENVTETTIAASATSGVVTLTASAAVWRAEHVGAWWEIAHRRETAFSEYLGAGSEGGTAFSGSSAAVRIVGRYEVQSYGIWSGTVHLEEQRGSVWTVIRSWTGKKDRQITITGTSDQEASYRLRVVDGVGYTSSTAAVPRFILEAADAKIYGLVRIEGFTNATTVTARVYGSLWSTDATAFWTEGAWSNVQGFPRAMTLHEQRTVWGGTALRPQALWASVVGDFENFRRSSLDDGSWFRTLASDSSHTIQWLVSQDELVVGTSRGFWIGSSEGGGILTPLAGTFTRRSGAGSAYRQALLVNESIVFLQANQLVLRRLSYRDDSQRVGSSDLTVLADHITVGGIQQFNWQREKGSIVWSVTTDGRLLGLTLEEEQNVFAWSQHETDGEFLSVAQMSGDGTGTDEVWCAVRRNGSVNIERFHPGTYAANASVLEAGSFVYVDAAVQRAFSAPVATVTGLEHLEGKTVQILGDGAEQSERVVNGGAVAIDPPAAKVTLGLPYVSKLQKMKVELGMQDGTAQGRKMKLSSVTVRLLNSLGGRVADDFDSRFEVINYRDALEPMNEAPPLFTGEKDVVIESRHRGSVDFALEAASPFPFNLIAVILKVDIYGN